MTNAVVSHIEREFGLESRDIGIMLASNDLSGVILVMFVSYYGSKGKKPRWLAIGSVITGEAKKDIKKKHFLI